MGFRTCVEAVRAFTCEIDFTRESYRCSQNLPAVQCSDAVDMKTSAKRVQVVAASIELACACPLSRNAHRRHVGRGSPDRAAPPYLLPHTVTTVIQRDSKSVTESTGNYRFVSPAAGKIPNFGCCSRFSRWACATGSHSRSDQDVRVGFAIKVGRWSPRSR